MNRLQLRIQRGQEIDADVVRVLIDDADLIDLVRPVELPFARAEGQPGIAGAYDGLLPGDWVELPEQYGDGRAALLGCTCGEVGCWPLRARVEERGESVTWSDFQQPHRREWSYESFGPFVFDRHRYHEEVAHLREQSRGADA